MSALDFNAVVNDFAAAQRAVAMPAESWTAWRLGERESDLIALNAPETLDDAVCQAMTAMSWQSGDTLAVQYRHECLGKITLWQFTVRRSTKHGTWRDATDGGRRVFVGRMEPKLTLQIELAAEFAPVLRFDALRDCPVGCDLTLVEAR